MTQEADILTHLKSGKTITSLQAIKEYGAGRLSARVCDLKDKGYDIHRRMIAVQAKNGKTKRVAEYFMSEKINQGETN